VIDGTDAELDVIGLPERRDPAPEARTHYTETAASVARREKLRQQHRLAELTRPRPEGRPDKRDRRKLVRIQRGQE
jgi:ribosome-associated heat shock protein Hsp15